MTRKKTAKTCLTCGANFMGFARSTYCCTKCRDLYNRERRAEQKKLWKKMKAKEADRQNGKTSCVEEANKIIRWIDEHYKKTGVLLSYGKAVAAMRK